MNEKVFDDESLNLKKTYGSLRKIIDELVEETEMPEYMKAGNYNNRDEIPSLMQQQREFNSSSRYTREKIASYIRILPEVYFSRIDIDFEGVVKTYYVSKHGLDSLGTTDWRTDIGALIYDQTTSTYNTKNNILLKRRFEISHDRLLSYDDVNFNIGKNSNITDEFLMRVLEEKKSNPKITDIIKSIQTEQNEIIRLPFNYNTAVLGCAGSGKTMILLHHLSYLKFHSQINWSKVKIITPNESFKEVFEELQKDLEIHDVEMISITEYFKSKLSRFGYRFDKDIVIDEYKIKNKEMLLRIYSVETQSEMFTKYANDLKVLFSYLKAKKANSYINESLNASGQFRVIEANIEYISNNIANDLKKTENQVRDLYEQYEDNFREIVSNAFTIIDLIRLEQLQSEGNITKSDGIILSIINTLDIIGVKDDKIDSIKKSNITNLDLLNLKNELSEYIHNYDNNLKRFDEIERELIEKSKVLDVLKKEVEVCLGERIKSNDETIRLKSKLDSISFFNFAENRRIKKQISDVNSKLLLLNNMLTTKNKTMSKISVEVELLKSTKEDLISYREKYCVYIQNVRDSIAAIETIYSLWKPISTVVKQLETRIKLLDLQKKYKWTVSLKAWFDNYFVKEHLNVILSEDGSNVIDENHKYNFYYFYLLLFLNTYSDKNDNYLSKDVLICIDEFQDISKSEIDLIKELNKNVTLNFYGDLNQRLLSKGYTSIDELPKNCHIFQLSNNYRNTIQITSYYNSMLNKNDIAVGVDGPEVTYITLIEFYSQNTDLKDAAFICQRELYNSLRTKIKNIKIMRVEEAKGLEFNTVYVYVKNMNENEQYISFSRALYRLFVVNE